MDHNNDLFAGAIWIGTLDLEEIQINQDLELKESSCFQRARILIWEAERIRGFIEVNIESGHIKSDELQIAISSLPVLHHTEMAAPQQPISVIVCTRDRPNDLQRCLAALLELRFPTFEIIVVDNAPTTEATRHIVESLSDKGVRYLRVPRPGLSRARNAGVRVARYEHVAFTDDDVVVDARWLEALDRGFAIDQSIACVTGLVATGELQSSAQSYFDRRVAWGERTVLSRFCLDNPPPDMPLFPFQFAAYGTGANFAAKRSVLFELGGFDEALGVGSPTGGAEDVDWFIRIVLDGRVLLYQPDAVVWHRHRVDQKDLSFQLESYGLGFGAVMAKLAGNPAARRAMLPLVFRALVYLRKILMVERTPGERAARWNAYREFQGMLRGPWALVRARRQGLPRPLHPDENMRRKSWT